jgi:hypothetical protein
MKASRGSTRVREGGRARVSAWVSDCSSWGTGELEVGTGRLTLVQDLESFGGGFGPYLGRSR